MSDDDMSEGHAGPGFAPAVHARMELEVLPTLPAWAAAGYRAGRYEWGVAIDDENRTAVVQVYVDDAEGRQVPIAALDGATVGVLRATTASGASSAGDR